jgi:hypothetical protein
MKPVISVNIGKQITAASKARGRINLLDRTHFNFSAAQSPQKQSCGKGIKYFFSGKIYFMEL